jgi:hypothetical protein
LKLVSSIWCKGLADEIRVKGRKMIAWKGLAMLVSTRLWVAGSISLTRDKTLADRLMRASCALVVSRYRAVQANVEPLVVELTSKNATNLLQGSALVVDAFDNREARAAVSEMTRLQSLPCIHIGFSSDGLYGSGIWEPNYKVPQEVPGNPCDYPLTRPLALILTSIAVRAIVDFFLNDQRSDIDFTWNDLKVGYTEQGM